MKEMYAVMVKTEDGMTFETCESLNDAHVKANNAACMGYEATVFDYDIETGRYYEFYSLPF